MLLEFISFGLVPLRQDYMRNILEILESILLANLCIHLASNVFNIIRILWFSNKFSRIWGFCKSIILFIIPIMLYFAVPIANILVHLICDLPQNEIHKANFDTQPYKYTYCPPTIWGSPICCCHKFCLSIFIILPWNTRRRKTRGFHHMNHRVTLIAHQWLLGN